MAERRQKDTSWTSSPYFDDQDVEIERSPPLPGSLGLSSDKFSAAASSLSLRSDPLSNDVQHSRHQSWATSTAPLTRHHSSRDGRLSTPLEDQPFPTPIVPLRRPKSIHEVEAPSHSESDGLSVLSDILSSYQPPLSRLASDASSRRNRTEFRRSRLLTPITEQRHPGKEGARLSRHHRQWEPETGDDNNSRQPELTETDGAVSSDDNEGHATGVPLLLLILGLCLVVFLISIDRTIITTVSYSCSFLKGDNTHTLYRRSHSSRPSFIQQQTSDGMARPICSPLVRFNRFSGACS
jgi:hypothetical protein